MSGQNLKILLLEDIAPDAELIQLQLEELEQEVEYRVTDKKDEFESLLYSFRPDLVIADFSLPGYDGMKALRYVRDKDMNIPFIFVTATLGEENAVTAIKAGASDFLVKENITRLPVAVMKALREKTAMHKKKGFERQLIAINALRTALLRHQSWKKALNEALAVIGEALRVDRVYFFENHIDDQSGQELISQRMEWSGASAESQIDNQEMQGLPFAAIPELMEPLKKQRHFQAIVPQLPDSAFKDILLDQDICSILVLPVFVKNKFSGFIGFDDCRYEREWSDDEHEFLTSLTSSLSNAIEKGQMLDDLKHREQHLKKVVTQLEKAEKIAHLGYWSYRPGSDVSEWSEECYRIYGYTPDNFVPTFENVKQTFHPDDRYIIERDLPETVTGDEEHQFEHRIITASGEVRWVDLRLDIVEDQDGRPAVIEGTVQDITERKKNEEELRISKERFELAMKASNEMIWDWDHSSDRVIRSFGYENVFGYQLQERASRDNSWFSKVHQEDLENAWTLIRATLRDRNSHHWEVDYRVRKPDGSFAYVVDRGFIIRDQDGEPLRSVGAVLDVTESRQQLEKIKKQNEALREIAWLQSHVVRAPLARIMGLVDIIKEPQAGDLSVDEVCDLVMLSAHELDDVIKDVTRKTESIKTN